MTINSRIREMIFKAGSAVDIRVQAVKDGMKTLYVDGMTKVMRGITSFEEVYRQAKRTEQDIIG
jgi:type IV pilus assembly protein PilB